MSTKGKETRDRARRAALVAYGGDPPTCACCGETMYQFLAIDHLNGGGFRHRKQIVGERKNPGGSVLYRWLRDHGYPPGYQVLCHNCNLAQGYYGQCPHDGSVT